MRFNLSLSQKQVFIPLHWNSGSDLFCVLYDDTFDLPILAKGLLRANDDDIVRPEITHDFTVALPAGSYTLVTTSFGNGTTAEYEIDITTHGWGRCSFKPRLHLYRCKPIVVYYPQSYRVSHATGNIIPALIAGGKRILDITGRPVVSDNFTNVLVRITDQLIEGTDCTNTIIRRTFTVTDNADGQDCSNANPAVVNNAVTCTQDIIIRKPTIDDVVLPPAIVELSLRTTLYLYPTPRLTRLA
ncbi:MAG: hypothetical protein R2795_08905 [Saprospiraceae bacterium]